MTISILTAAYNSEKTLRDTLESVLRQSCLPDIELTDLRNTIYKMVGKELIPTGGRTYRRYELSDGRKEKK